MTSAEIILEILKLRDWSQGRLAEEAGYKRQSNVGNFIIKGKDNSLRLNSLLSMVEAMGCEIIIRDKMGSKKEWKIT